MCVPSPFRSKVTRYVAAVVSTASICPVNNPSCAPRRRASQQQIKKKSRTFSVTVIASQIISFVCAFITSDFCSYVESQRDFIGKVFAVRHIRNLSLLQQTHLVPLLPQSCPFLNKKCRGAPGRYQKAQNYLHQLNKGMNFLLLNTDETAYRRGFPISLLIVPHSTLVNFLVFRLGKDSLRHRQNSLSPSKRGRSMFE